MECIVKVANVIPGIINASLTALYRYLSQYYGVDSLGYRNDVRVGKHLQRVIMVYGYLKFSLSDVTWKTA